MSSRPNTRLGSIFQEASAASSSDQGNASLRYIPPKEPARTQASAVAAAAPATTATAAAPEKASSIVYTATVSLYQYDTAARSYVQILNANSSATIGCVIVGSDANYNLLFYNAAKQHVCLLPLKFATFKPVLQPKNYVSFYDDKGVNWSVKFASEQHVSDFMRQVFLTKIHVEIWGDDKSVTKTAPNALIKDDLAFVKDDTPAVSAGDAVAVAFSCWRVVGNVTCAPSDVVTKYAPFEKAGEAELRKFRLGDGSERIKALDEGVVGMRKGGKRIILAPPGKTTGQDWYLLEVHLVKVKISGSGGATRKASVPPPAAVVDTAPSGSNGKAVKTPRRRSSPAPGVDTSATGDIVPWGSESAQEELKLKDQQMRMLQEQLEALKMNSSLGLNAGFAGLQQQQQQQHAFAPQSAFSQAAMFSGVGGGGAGSLFTPAQQHPLMTMAGRPLDTLLTELHAKVDYLIRIAPAPGSGSSGGGAIGGATDVSAVIRGVERLASENDRLMVQINAQNQQYVSYEKRCEELLKQSQQLQDEKRRAEEKYQAIASQQLSYSSELASLTSARDAAITQTNRLHAEYQQLLTAFYQKQQVSSVSEEQRNELNFEREARVRAERELKKESQTRALAEQELQLAKKQFDVTLKLKDSELATQKQALETQWLTAKTQELKDRDEQLRHATLEFQQQTARQQEDFRQQLERKDAQLEAAQLEVQTLSSDKVQLTAQLASASDQVAELERELQVAVTASTTNATASGDGDDDDSAAIRLADEERQIYAQQIALLQQQVKDLEAQQFQRVQDELASGRLASPGSSPRSARAKSFGECDRCAGADAKEQAAERALALAQSLKREAEEMLAARGASNVSDAQAAAAADREKLTTLFKEAVNEMFFRFQDFFEEEAAVESKHVLAVIRKVLKQSTKDVIQRLQVVPLPALDDVGDNDNGDDVRDDVSDGPPAPPPLEPATTPAPVAIKEVAVPTSGGEDDDDATKDDDDATKDDDDATKDTVRGHSSRRASSSVDADVDVDAADPSSLFMESVSARMQVPGGASGYVSTDDEFED